MEARSESSRKLGIGNAPHALVRHDYKRSVYRALLSEFAPGEVREYFEKVPLMIGGERVDGKRLYELLWRKKSLVPISWEDTTDNLLEEFIISKGRRPAEIMPKILWLSGGSSPIPGKVILSWFYPKVEALFNKVDTRDMCFGLITLVTENWLPGRIHRRIRRREKGEWVENVLVFINDATFSTYLDWDYEFIGGPQVVEAPAKLGLPPFERFGMLADTRPPERIVRIPEDAPLRSESEFSMRGEPAGRIMPFSSFCKSIELDVSAFNPTDTEVVVMDRDYLCPKRGRVVLHKGCAYGAPFFISRTEHRKLADSPPSGVLGNLVSDIGREEREEEADGLEIRHRALLESLGESTVFAYNAGGETMSMNGRHFVKGIPAKILRALLQAHLGQGKTEFEYRDFKGDFEISLGQKNSNFEVRFYRLIEKLSDQGSCLSIEKTGRGTFSLRVRGTVKLVDQSS